MKRLWCIVISILVSLFFAHAALGATHQITQIKIALDQDGIYQLDYTALQIAGWDVENVDPNQFALAQRGEPVHFQFIGDEDAQFEVGEAIRFYGWAFDGDERQYVKQNVFWLTADGGGERVETVEQIAGGERVERVSAEISYAPENVFSLTYTRHWPTFDNPFDSWYWLVLTKDATLPAAITLPIDIPHPSPNGVATYQIETLDQKQRITHLLTPSLNGHVAPTHYWDGLVNQNITNPISQTLLLNGPNLLTLELQSEGADGIYLNRVTVNYERELIAENNALAFGHAAQGEHTFAIRGITDVDPSQLLFWDISNRHAPKITALNDPISGTYEIGVAHDENAKFLLTHQADMLQPVALSTYAPQSIEPAGDGAEWVAITHSRLMTETLRLAEQRETHSRLTTHVVAVEEIFEQYGHGLPLPHAIHAYLQHAYSNWALSPEYVLLVGDASLNPRGMACQGSCFSDWTTDDENLVPTFLEPLDRYMGLVPVDHFFTLLEGDDDLPDVAIGRLPSQNSAELAAIIDKIIIYEQNLVNPNEWTQHISFFTDNTDNAGNFCHYAHDSAAHWPQQFQISQLCLDKVGDVEVLRAAFFERINQGVLINQYLGHGFIGGWASEGVLRNDDMPLLQNSDRPFVQISGNCLDGNYAWVGSDSIGEALLQHAMGGTAAHWGAPGLGYLFEHYALHQAFVAGATEQGHTRIGDAIRYAKANYLSKGWYYAPQAYSSTLLGDPAMQLFHAELGVAQSAETTTIAPAEPLTIEVQITNRGLIDSAAEVEIIVPDGVKLVDLFSPKLAHSGGHDVRLTGKIMPGESVTSTITVQVIDSNYIGGSVTIETTVTGDGFESDLGDNSAATTLDVIEVDFTAVQLKRVATSTSNIGLGLMLCVLLLLSFFTCQGGNDKYSSRLRRLNAKCGQLQRPPVVIHNMMRQPCDAK